MGNLLFKGTKLLKEGMAEADRELIQLDSEFLQSQFDRLRATFPEGEPDLANYLANLALSTGRVKNDDGVRLLTVHAAKGLEFEVVWVVGLNQGSFPDYRSLSSEESLAEERRAAYVAVTRAGQRLFLSRPCRRKMPWGEEKSQQRSQFLGEMGLLAAVMSKPLGVAEKVEEYVIPE